MKKFISLKSNNYKKNIFINLTVLIIIVLFISMFFSLNLIKQFYYVELDIDILGDFRNIYYMLFYYSNPYNTGNISIDSSYPPFALLLYFPFMIFFVFYNISPAITQFLSQFFFLIIPVTILFLLCRKMLKQKNILLIICLFFVYPIVFLFHRANVLIYCFMFVMIFINFYKSEKPVYRELSLLSLAAAAAIKIYPLVFLMLLFNKGRLFDIIKTLFYFLILFFVPFLFFEGGFSNFSYFIKNMSYFSNTYMDYSKIKLDSYSFVSFLQFVSIIFKGKINADSIVNANNILTVFILILVVFSCLILKHSYKIYALLAILITFVPVVSFVYTQVFFIPAFICFIKTSKKTKSDIYYFILFLIILLPINRLIFYYNYPVVNVPINFPWYYNNPFANFAEDWTPMENPINTFIAVFSMFLMLISIITQAVIKFIKNIKNNGFLITIKSLFDFTKNIC